MGLPLLKSLVRIELRVGVFEADDQADGDAIVGEAVDPAAAVHVGGNGPAERVGDEARLDAAGLDVPQFLDAEAVDLRIDVVELIFFDELLGERAARAFGEDGDFGAQFVAGRVVVFGLAVFVDALVFGDDAGDSVVFVDEGGATELREEIYAGGFHQAAQPFHELVERDDVVAFVLERRRRDRKSQGRVLGEEVELRRR